MRLQRLLNALFSEIVKETKANPQFAQRLEHALEVVQRDAKPVVRSHRRAPALLDPFAEFEKGESLLVDRLAGLDLEQLRDVVAQFGMDRSKLAMKWKDKNRVIGLIVKTVATRTRKGDAFRDQPGENSPVTSGARRHGHGESGSGGGEHSDS
jgi:hypothetical protein